MIKVTCIAFLLCLHKEASSIKLPGPQVYVVTPSPRPVTIAGRSVSTVPFYYNNWMRRKDSPEQNATITTTTAVPKVETPDLIFAEFEKGDTLKKSIKSLLEKERIKPTTAKPVPEVKAPNHGIPFHVKEDQEEQNGSHRDVPDYLAMYNNNFNSEPAPVYLPSTTLSTTRYTTFRSTLGTTTSNETPPSPQASGNVENIWHIIDSEKTNQNEGKWNEVPIESNHKEDENSEIESSSDQQEGQSNKGNGSPFDENFALPGFSTNPVNGGENESRAIRTEPNVRFPYINLKPLQMKNSMKPYMLNKKGNNMLNLDNLRDVKHPVRGEIQDVMPGRQSIDRYNPAQPYLPSEYGSKSKQSSPISQPTKSVANLVPPPPPPVAGDDFPPPTIYDSFPPYSPPSADSVPAPPSPPAKPLIQFPDTSDDFGTPPDSYDTPPTDTGYRYKTPSPSLPFVPTLPPVSKPFKGYIYANQAPEISPMPNGDDSDFGGYQNNKPEAPAPKGRPSYGPQQDAPLYQPEYPELIYDNPPHGGMDGYKATDMGMMPPPPPDMKPVMTGAPISDDQGFPHDFPGDFKYHDLDDHDFYHQHHHHPTTTTSTTETPRVNRFSYYYLGKKLYYLPLYFSVYFIVYVGALIIKAVLRHKIVYPNSWRPNDQTAGFFAKRSIDSWDLSNEKLHEITGRVTHGITEAARKYLNPKKDT